MQAFAAASAFFPIVFFMIAFFIGIASGATVLIGQAYGARDEERLKAVAGTTLTLCLGLGVVIGGLGWFFGPQLIGLIRTPPDVFAQSLAYARVTFLGLPVLFTYLAYTTFVRGTGDSRTPFLALIVSTMLNLLFTPALIRGWLGLPQLGIVSAAIANILSSVFAIAFMLVALALEKNPLAFDMSIVRHMKLEPRLVGTLLRIGLPTGVQLVMVSLSEIAVIALVNRFGSSATAAYGAVNQIVSYVQFPAISIGIASSIFGAQSIGAKRFDRLTKVARAGVGLNWAIGAVLIGLVYAFNDRILSAVRHRRGGRRDGARAARDHAVELPAVRHVERALGADALQRHGAVAHAAVDHLDLGRGGSGRVLARAAPRPARRVDRVSGRVRVRHDVPADLLLRLLAPQEAHHAARRQRPGAARRDVAPMAPEPRLAKSYAANVALVVLTLFPGLINTSAIALAAAVIGPDLGVAPDVAASLPLISDAALAFGCILAAELIRRVESRTLYFWLLGVSLATSLASAVAPSFPVLLAAHVVHGLVAGMLFVVVLPPLVIGFGSKKLGASASVLVPALFGAATLGPLVGGLVASPGLWRSIFAVETVVAIVAMVLARGVLAKARTARRRRARRLVRAARVRDRLAADLSRRRRARGTRLDVSARARADRGGHPRLPRADRRRSAQAPTARARARARDVARARRHDRDRDRQRRRSARSRRRSR